MKTITDLSQLDLTKRYTYADYLLWQFEERIELIKGLIVKMSPAPRRKHQMISNRISTLFTVFYNDSPCNVYYAPFDVRLIKNKGLANHEIDTVVQPDISIICDIHKLDDFGCIGAPDLIVEILSPGNKKWDEVNKYKLYEENGVKEYWIVDPDSKSVKVFILKADKYELVDYYETEGKMIPVNIFEGLVLSYDDIFRE